MVLCDVYTLPTDIIARSVHHVHYYIIDSVKKKFHGNVFEKLLKQGTDTHNYHWDEDIAKVG